LKQLNDREKDYEKLEVEIVLLRREIEKEKKQSKFVNNTKILNDILNRQRSPNAKTRLGYDLNSTSILQKTDKQSISYADTLRSSLKREDNKIKMAPLNTGFNKQAPPPKGKGNTMIRRNPPNRYQHIFLGYFYSCNNFGHKEVHCKAYRNYKSRNFQRYNNNKNDVGKRNYNSFSPLQKYNVECHK
jgi:hypothetical protein